MILGKSGRYDSTIPYVVVKKSYPAHTSSVAANGKDR